MKALIYDIEIIKAVPMRKEPTIEGIEYCAGWDDHANMGISVIGAYDYAQNRYRVFCKDNWSSFIALCSERDTLVTFNGIGFDNKVIEAVLKSNIATYSADTNNYDILAEMWEAAGLGRKFVYPTHAGFGLDATAQANFGGAKTGSGAMAPVEWQRGNVGTVIDYCLGDVRLTKRLFDRILVNGGLRDPRDSGRFLEMNKPELV